MDELKIGSLLAHRAEMGQYAAAMPLGMSDFPVAKDVRRRMEAEAKARHEKQMRMRRAAMVVDFAQALALAALPALPALAREAIEAAEAFITAAEEYLAEKGE